MQNVPYLRTAQDLERKYKLYAIADLEKNVQKNEEDIIKTNNIIEDFAAQTIGDIENLQNQIDGNITTYFFSGVPTLSNQPASDWDVTEYNTHLGDLYYDQNTGYAYRFYYDSTNDTYGWQKLTDSDVTEALALANAAQDTADSKRRVFVTTPTPPYDVGDIWFKQDEDLYRCRLARQEGDTYQSSDWILATKYTDDTAANNAIAQLNSYKTEVATTYSTKTELSTATDTINASISRVETVANSKNKVFTSEPTTPYHVGDVYLKEVETDGVTQNLIYVCQVERLTGNYDEEDFMLQPSYASNVDLELTATDIRSSVAEIQADYVTNSQLQQTSAGLTIEINEAKATTTQNTQTLNNMKSNFSTAGLEITSSLSEFRSLFNDKGVHIYNQQTLLAIFSPKGTGVKKLIVEQSIQLQNIKISKATKTTQRHGTIPVIVGDWLENLIESIDELEVD